MKQLIVYDLDGTLAESKSALDAEMSGLLHDLLGVVKVAVISGGEVLGVDLGPVARVLVELGAARGKQ
jgi:hydroxymethylpyrimidine pyrophosphatase-like HAD family hydrolase